MTRTKAILKVLQRERYAEARARVLRIFGVETIEECDRVYDSLGNAERASLDAALANMIASMGAAFELSVDNEMR